MYIFIFSVVDSYGFYIKKRLPLEYLRYFCAFWTLVSMLLVYIAFENILYTIISQWTGKYGELLFKV